MVKKIVIAIIVLSSMSGCATMEWRKPGETPAEWEKDQMECSYQVDLQVPLRTNSMMLADVITRSDLFAKCLKIRGWRLEKK